LLKVTILQQSPASRSFRLLTTLPFSKLPMPTHLFSPLLSLDPTRCATTITRPRVRLQSSPLLQYVNNFHNHALNICMWTRSLVASPNLFRPSNELPRMILQRLVLSLFRTRPVVVSRGHCAGPIVSAPSGSPPRNSYFPNVSYNYSSLLPCLETCNAHAHTFLGSSVRQLTPTQRRATKTTTPP